MTDPTTAYVFITRLFSIKVIYHLQPDSVFSSSCCSLSPSVHRFMSCNTFASCRGKLFPEIIELPSSSRSGCGLGSTWRLGTMTYWYESVTMFSSRYCSVYLSIRCVSGFRYDDIGGFQSFTCTSVVCEWSGGCWSNLSSLSFHTAHIFMFHLIHQIYSTPLECVNADVNVI